MGPGPGAGATGIPVFIDCVVMGSRGLSELQGLFLGSVSHKVANHAPCTCITVK